jgi:aspartate kinase
MTNANTIGIVLFQEDMTAALMKHLNELYELVTVDEVAMVCVIGSNIAKPGVLAHATKALAEANINILAITQTARQTNIQFVISRTDFLNAQKQLHSTLIEGM